MTEQHFADGMFPYAKILLSQPFDSTLAETWIRDTNSTLACHRRRQIIAFRVEAP